MRKKRIDYAELSDEELMQRYCRGDISGFDELYYRYSKRLFYFFYKATNHREKSEDLLQDLFFKIAQRYAAFDTSKKFSTWIYTIANNIRINSYRKSKLMVDETVETDELEGGGDYPVNEVDRIMTLEKLNSELEKLTEDERLCFILRFREDFSVRETAEILKCPEGTVKSRIYYTLKKLTVIMKEYNPNNFEANYEKK